MQKRDRAKFKRPPAAAPLRSATQSWVEPLERRLFLSNSTTSNQIDELLASSALLEATLGASVGQQPTGSLSGKIVYTHAGHGSTADYAAGPNPGPIAAVDLTGDGRPDIAVGNRGNNTIRVLAYRDPLCIRE